MEQSHHNKLRAFAEVVSLDAWHTPIPDSPNRMMVHADVVFSEGRLGGESESQVRFRLRMKRAEVVIIAPKTEPLTVDKLSVSRDSPQIKIKKTGEQSLDVQTGSSANTQVKLSPSTFSLQSEGSAEIKAACVDRHAMKYSEDVRAIGIKQTKTPDGHYRWELKPNIGDSLDGRPWDASTEPRLAIIDTRPGVSKSLPPVTRVEVRCLREDLHISSIELKDGSLWKQIKKMKGFVNKKAAAEAYIKQKLLLESLPCGDIGDPYCSIILASISTDTQ